ncbi:MAG: hypothetical protein H0T42_23760 [Deltaproteobacteria bacterium]|nr:hypothetical protein [Deltaproteobacteria bacterium]
MRSIVWLSEPLAGVLRERLTAETTIVSSAREFLDAQRDAKTLLFVDSTTIEDLDGSTMPGPVIGICDGTLQSAINWLPSRPWLSHVLSSSMLSHPLAGEHLNNVIQSVSSGQKLRLLDWVGPTMSGRRVRLAQASRRAERLERMSDFLNSKGVSARTIQHLRDAAEELLTNAFYDAPVAAGAVDQPISRTQDVKLPDDDACDLVYGCRDDLAIVRLRDPFGSLTRARLVEVLSRCAQTGMQVEVDESMGGAGLGLWRIFSAASFVAISVVAGRHTEFLVGIAKRGTTPKPFAFHLFFKDGKKRTRSVETSVTIVPK